MDRAMLREIMYPNIVDPKIAKEIHAFRKTKGTFPKILAFCRILKNLRIDIATRKVVDVCRSLEYINIANKGDFYLALRANLLSRHEDFPIFNQVFELFWRLPDEYEEAEEEVGNEVNSKEPEEEVEKEKEIFLEDWGRDEAREGDLEEETLPGYSPLEVLSTKDNRD